MERSAEINNYLASLYSTYETGFTLKPIYILYGHWVLYFTPDFAKIDFKKIASKDFLPLFPPPKKNKITHGHGFCNDVTTTTTTTTTIKQYKHNPQ